MTAVDATSVVYLLHFDEPYGHARHYMGWTSDLDRRLSEHAAGASRSGRLPQVFHDAGIGFTLARTWAADRNRERRLKVQGGHSRKCPLCKGREPLLEVSPATVPQEVA